MRHFRIREDDEPTVLELALMKEVEANGMQYMDVRVMGDDGRMKKKRIYKVKPNETTTPKKKKP